MAGPAFDETLDVPVILLKVMRPKEQPLGPDYLVAPGHRRPLSQRRPLTRRGRDRSGLLIAPAAEYTGIMAFPASANAIIPWRQSIFTVSWLVGQPASCCERTSAARRVARATEFHTLDLPFNGRMARSGEGVTTLQPADARNPWTITEVETVPPRITGTRPVAPPAIGRGSEFLSWRAR